MPAVITDTSLRPGIVSQDTSIFDYPNTPAPSVLALQVPATQPLPGRTSTATGLLFPDLLISRRLVNFPEEVYTLQPSSLLVRFMAALMGPAGAGQLRQRQLVARLQAAICGTHFYDLDAFYGALFNARRGDAGALPQNASTGTTFSPYTDLATQDGWDDIDAQDSRYRERVIQLARAIAMGGTIPGIQAMAEAITRVPCDVYEVWRLIDFQSPEGVNGLTWNEIQTDFPTWAAASGQSWDQMQDIVMYGVLGINARNEVIIQPQRTYSADLASQQQAITDASGIMDVVRVLAPDFALVSVSTTGSLVDSPVAIAGLAADSDYWEVIGKAVLPSAPPTAPVAPPNAPSSPSSAPPPSPYAGWLQAYDRGGQLQDPGGPMKPAIPPFSQGQGSQYSHVSSIAQSFSSVSAQAVASTSDLISAAQHDLKNFQVVTFPDGSQSSYQPSWGITDPVTAAAGRAASPTSKIAAPYSGARAPVKTAG